MANKKKKGTRAGPTNEKGSEKRGGRTHQGDASVLLASHLHVVLVQHIVQALEDVLALVGGIVREGGGAGGAEYQRGRDFPGG